MEEAVKLEEDVATRMTVTREGGLIRSPLTVADEIEIFAGIENKLSLNQTYSKVFQCTYKLQNYPFDRQVCCHIKFYLTSSSIASYFANRTFLELCL